MMARRSWHITSTTDAGFVIVKQRPGGFHSSRANAQHFPTARFRTREASPREDTKESSSSAARRVHAERDRAVFVLCTRNIDVPSVEPSATRTDQTAYLPSVNAASLFVVRATAGASILNGAPGRN